MAPGLSVLVDSSVWIAIFRGFKPWTAEYLAKAFFSRKILVADLVFVEVVRGAKTHAEARLIEAKLHDFEHVSISNMSLARTAVDHHRYLRTKGVTVRGTVDLLIATWCIENDVPLLHVDRDFTGFEEHLGLKRWVTGTPISQ
jgi:predicted nucleic acid-binding protein